MQTTKCENNQINNKSWNRLKRAIEIEKAKETKHVRTQIKKNYFAIVSAYIPRPQYIGLPHKQNVQCTISCRTGHINLFE